TYDQATPNERVLVGFANSWSYYAVYRTEALRKIRRGVVALALKDLQVHEKFCAMETLRLGKAICFPHITSYLRQYETSTRNTDIVKDWLVRVTRNEWAVDVLKVLKVMAACGVDEIALERAWIKWYNDHL